MMNSKSINIKSRKSSPLGRTWEKLALLSGLASLAEFKPGIYPIFAYKFSIYNLPINKQNL